MNLKFLCYVEQLKFKIILNGEAFINNPGMNMSGSR